jgi:acyl-coenzyme A synthetase/AMP-(fatty) acid ligase
VPAETLRDLVFAALRSAAPGRPAVLDGPRTLTYGELSARAALLAGRLAGATGPVPLPLPRGAAAVTAQVACILAGRPFFPMDPAAGPPPPGEAGDCGYLLTTSGTTGTPKVVRGSAPALANYLRWQRSELGLTPGDVLTNTADPWFDFSFKETLGALVAGATVVVVEPAALTHGAALLRRLAACRPTVVCLLPSRLSGLVDAMRHDPVAASRATGRLRLLLVSGEPFPAALLRRWREVAPEPTVLNLYGPTESTVIKLRHVVPPGATVGTDTVPVGHPIPGTDVEVLPTGELCLLSGDLALGYLGAGPGATRFDRDDDGRPRLHTGDLARLTPDGLVELCGRLDHAVKRRGVRVSLPAIETAALRHPRVHAAAAVWTRERVVLFYAPAPGAEVTARAMRTALLDRLAPEQLPDQVRPTAALPLDGRGKVDRAALRAAVAP